MGEATFSVRLDPEARDLLQAQVNASGMSAKDYVTRWIESREAAQARESMVDVKELRDLRHHLGRVDEMFISMTKAGQDREEAAAARIRVLNDQLLVARAAVAEEREKADQVIADAAARIDAAERDAASAREAAQKEVWETKDALARALEGQNQAVKLAGLAEEAAAAAKAKCAELQDLAAHAQAYQQEATEARKDAQHAKDALARAVEQANLEKEMAAERAQMALERAVLETRSEAVGVREELARAREDLAKATMEKAALELRVAGSGQKKKGHDD